MEHNAYPELVEEFVNTNPFAAKRTKNIASQSDAKSAGKRPRIMKPLYSARLS